MVLTVGSEVLNAHVIWLRLSGGTVSVWSLSQRLVDKDGRKVRVGSSLNACHFNVGENRWRKCYQSSLGQPTTSFPSPGSLVPAPFHGSTLYKSPRQASVNTSVSQSVLKLRRAWMGFCVRMSRGGLSIGFLGCIFHILGLLWIVEQTVATPIRDGLLPNGDFEYAPKPSAMNGTVVIGKNSIPFWQIGGFVEYISSGQKQGDMLLIVPNGVHAARLGNEARLTQRIEVKKGSYYSLTFSVARTCAQMETLNVSVPPDAGELPMQTIYSSTGWDSYAWAFRAPAKMVDVIVHNPGMDDDPACGPLIDDIAIKELFPPPYVGGNLVRNGNFEEGPLILRNSSSGVLLPPNTDDDHSPLPGWKLESLKAVKYIDAFHYSIPRGRRAVELLAGKESAIVQLVTTVAGKAYALSFLVGDGNNKCNGSMIVEAFGDRETVKVPYESQGSGGFKMGKLTFTATSARSRIAFFSTYYHMRSDDFSSLCGPVVDDVKLFPL